MPYAAGTELFVDPKSFIRLRSDGWATIGRMTDYGRGGVDGAAGPQGHGGAPDSGFGGQASAGANSFGAGGASAGG